MIWHLVDLVLLLLLFEFQDTVFLKNENEM